MSSIKYSIIYILCVLRTLYTAYSVYLSRSRLMFCAVRQPSTDSSPFAHSAIYYVLIAYTYVLRTLYWIRVRPILCAVRWPCARSIDILRIRCALRIVHSTIRCVLNIAYYTTSTRILACYILCIYCILCSSFAQYADLMRSRLISCVFAAHLILRSPPTFCALHHLYAYTCALRTPYTICIPPMICAVYWASANIIDILCTP